MKAKELLTQTVEELQSKEAELRKELVKLRAQASTGTQQKNPTQIKATRKNIARLLTIIRQKEIAQLLGGKKSDE
jgi:large subunit ribosomal protein L29